jgi:hypothetical protein
MQMTLSGNQLLISAEQDINLNLQINGNIQNNVLENKSLNKDRLDITKLAKIKDHLQSCDSKKLKVAKITFELECV